MHYAVFECFFVRLCGFQTFFIPPPLLSHNAPLSANWRLHPPNHWFFSIDYTFEIESWNMQIKNDRKQNMTTKRFSYLERAQRTPGCHVDNSGPSMSHIWSNSLGRSWEPNKMAQVEIPNRVFGRFVRPLQRLVLNYCKHGGSSRGIRYSIDCWEYFSFLQNNFWSFSCGSLTGSTSTKKSWNSRRTILKWQYTLENATANTPEL